jgi:hypothetical protein
MVASIGQLRLEEGASICGSFCFTTDALLRAEVQSKTSEFLVQLIA